MATNTQNTVPGTLNGANVISTLGNQVLDAFASISNVGVNVAGQAGQILDSIGSLKGKYEQIFNSNQSSVPQETAPAWQISSWPDFLSDPKRVQSLIVYGAAFSLIAVGTVWLVKKL